MFPLEDYWTSGSRASGLGRQIHEQIQKRFVDIGATARSAAVRGAEFTMAFRDEAMVPSLDGGGTPRQRQVRTFLALEKAREARERMQAERLVELIETGRIVYPGLDPF